MLVSFILILVVVNAIVYQNPTQWDWTEGKQNTLAPETISTLKSLPAQFMRSVFLLLGLRTPTHRICSIKFKPRATVSLPMNSSILKPILQGSTIQNNAGCISSIGYARPPGITYESTQQDFANALVRLMNPGQRTFISLSATANGIFKILAIMPTRVLAQCSNQKLYCKIPESPGSK